MDNLVCRHRFGEDLSGSLFILHWLLNRPGSAWVHCMPPACMGFKFVVNWLVVTRDWFFNVCVTQMVCFCWDTTLLP